MANLKTTWLGLPVETPLLLSASPFTQNMDYVEQINEAPFGAVVLHSLFEEQVEKESLALNYYLEAGTESFAEALTYFPEMTSYNVGPEKYLEKITAFKSKLNKPVIASLNGFTPGGWLEYAKRMQDAGADGLELNVYFLPSEFDMNSKDVEDSYVELVEDIRNQISIPLAIKLSPYFTSLPQFANRLVEAGVNGLVLFNRFYQPVLNIEQLKVETDLHLSTSEELKLPLRWAAIMYGRLKTDFGLTSGIHTPEDLVKTLAAGGQVGMAASTFLRKGLEYSQELVSGLEKWMDEHDYKDVQSLRGSLSQQAIAEPSAYERANYIKIIQSFPEELKTE